MQQLLFNCLIFLMLICSFSCNREGAKQQSGADVVRSKQEEKTSVTTDPQIVPNAPARITRKIRKTKDGNLLFAAFENIILFDGETFVHLPKPEGLKSFDAFDALEDAQGNIWIASTHFGVYKYDGQTYTHYTTKEGLAGERAMCILEDSKGRIWIGTDAGITCFDGQSVQNITTVNGLTSNDINVIVEDRSGKIWVGTRGTLNVYEPNATGIISFKKFQTKAGESFANIWGIVEDQKGRLWLGGQGGLWKIESEEATQLATYGVTGIVEDSAGKLWINHQGSGPHQAGSSYFDLSNQTGEMPKATPVFTEENMFFGVTEGNNREIWIGSLRGVIRYDGKSVVHFKDKVAEKAKPISIF